MSFFQRWRRVFAAVRRWLPLGFEIGLTILSCHAAWELLTDPDYFDRNHVQYHWLVEHFTREEWQLGLLALVAASTKAAGIVLLWRRSERAQEVAFALREVGLGGSFVFWLLMGITWSVGNPSSLAAWLGVVVSLQALAMMAAGPVVPEDTRNER